MATRTENEIRPENKLEERLDKRFDPQALRDAEQGSSGGSGYQDESGAANDDPASSQRTTSASESLGANFNNQWGKPDKEGSGAAEKAEWFKRVLSNPRAVAGELLKVAIKNKSPGALLLAIVAFFGFFSLAGPAMAPFSLLENLQIDLDDLTAGLTVRSERLMLRKISPTGSSCRVLASLRCKQSTISEKEARRLKANGIDIVGEDIGGGRTRATAYRFRGQNYDPVQWRQAINTRNHPARLASLRAHNMKYMSFKSKSFGHLVLRRFGVSKKPAELEGTMQERVNKLLQRTDRTMADMAGARIEVRDGQNVLVDGDGQPMLGPDGNPITYTDAEVPQVNEVLRNSGAVPDQTPTIRSLPRGMVGAFSVLGYVDTACSIRDMVGMAAVAAKVLTYTSLAKWAFGVASYIHEAKASDSSETKGAALGKMFTDIDTRKEVVDLASPNKNNPRMKKNKNYRKSAMDSALVLMSIAGGVAEPNDTDKMFSLGMGQNRLLQAASSAVDASGMVLSDTLCNVVQNPIVRAGGIAITIAGAVGSSGASLAGQAAIVAGQIAAMIILNYVINSALQSSPLAAFENRDETVGIGSAFWSGLAAINSSNAQGHGFTPTNRTGFVRYKAMRDEINDEYIALEKQDANPLDITNQYSFLGSIAHSFGKTFGYTSSPSISTLVSALPSTFRTVANDNASALVETNLLERLSRCDDKNYAAIELDADVQCNVRYALSQVDIDKDLDQVHDWMEGICGVVLEGETTHCVEPDSTTGLPAGYIPPMTNETQGGLINAVKDMAVSSTIGQFFAPKNYDEKTPYEAWLDFCTFRTMPLGDTYNAFGDASLAGQADEGWLNGSYCMLEDNSPMGQMVSNFRTYWQFKSINEVKEDDNTPEGGLAAVGAAGGAGVLPFSGRLVSPVAPGSNGVMQTAPYGRYPSGGAHYGLDLASGSSWNIVSACDGEVVAVDIKPAYANRNAFRVSGSTNYVWIDCGNNVLMGYAHFYARDLNPAITVGARVGAGTFLFPQGNQGNSSGAHLHYQVSTVGSRAYTREATTDPRAFLAQHGVQLP